ncbi:hypothetical protein RchiOBHm_Chr1g0371901 [Rosa chinensis]|uniref:Uncharacterized protein n=1 Tax=Rosa chinensis TaxID=74649 RepID=A0A2P6SLN9_ROSCH|nr:hypothetical protein RchiOBHm_Chr1g0371901 [Rosa chinensis]
MASGEGAVRFPLSDSSTLVIQMGDITKWFVDGSTDAILLHLLYSLGEIYREILCMFVSFSLFCVSFWACDALCFKLYVYQSIHRAAGRDLLQACYGVPEARPGVRCPTGKARITL